MNKKELASIVLVVLAFIFVAVIATSDIPSLISDPDYLGAIPGTLCSAIRNSTDKATAYVRLHGFPRSLKDILQLGGTNWLTLLRQYESVVASVLPFLFFILSRRDRRRAMAADALETVTQSVKTMAEAITKMAQKRDDDDAAFKVTQKVDPA